MEFKRSGFKQIMISICLFVVLELVLSVVLITLDESIYGLYDDPDYISPIVEILSISLTTIIVLLEYLFSRLSYVNKLENSADNLKHSISIYVKKNNELYNKANGLYNRYLLHEKEVHLNLGNKDTSNVVKIDSINTLNEAIQFYPELKGNSHMGNLLNQIERSEDELSNIKQHYNNMVSLYNEEVSKILIKLFTRRKKLNYYSEEIENTQSI